MPTVSSLTATPAYGPGDAVYVVTGAGNSRKLVTLRVATIANLTAIAAPTNGMSVQVTDVNRGGLFVFDTALTAAANSGTTFKADDATTGSWVRQFTGPVDVRWFGAVGSGANDTTAIQSAFDAADDVYIPTGVFSHAGLTLSANLCGPGTLLYTGAGNGITAASRVTISEVVIDSAGSDLSNLYITSSTGVVISNGATIQNGFNNIVINGVTNALEVGDGAYIKDARNDNIFCIQGKRFVVAPGAFIAGAAGWGINCDSTTAALPDQQHGFILNGQIWGNVAGGIRVVGTAAELTQHPIICAHIDHNQDDLNTDAAYGIYLDYVTRPIISGCLIRAHRTTGLYCGNVVLPTITGNIFWKNGTSYNMTANTSRPMLIGNSEDDVVGTIANPADAIVVGSGDFRSFGNVRSNGGYYHFGDIGHIRQFLTGGGAGNAEIDLNAAAGGRALTVKNAAFLDLKLLVEGHMGCRVFASSPPGTVTNHIQIFDETGTLAGYIPVHGV